MIHSIYIETSNNSLAREHLPWRPLRDLRQALVLVTLAKVSVFHCKSAISFVAPVAIYDWMVGVNERKD